MSDTTPHHNWPATEVEGMATLAAELRELIADDASDMMVGAMIGSSVECLAFAKSWIQRVKGLKPDLDDVFAEPGESPAPAEEHDWVIHITGSDDVLPQPDEVTALREANATNKLVASRERHPHDPVMIALVKDRKQETA